MGAPDGSKPDHAKKGDTLLPSGDWEDEPTDPGGIRPIVPDVSTAPVFDDDFPDYDEEFDTQTVEVTEEVAARLAAAYRDILEADEDDGWDVPTPAHGGQTLMPRELQDALQTMHPESAAALMREFENPVRPEDFGSGTETLLPATPEVLRTLLGEANPHDATLFPGEANPSVIEWDEPTDTEELELEAAAPAAPPPGVPTSIQRKVSVTPGNKRSKPVSAKERAKAKAKLAKADKHAPTPSNKTVYGFDAFDDLDDEFDEFAEDFADSPGQITAGNRSVTPSPDEADTIPPDSPGGPTKPKRKGKGKGKDGKVDADAPTMIWINRTTGSGVEESDAPAPSAQAEPRGPRQQRFVDLGIIGVGGMGEVRRVFERSFKRVLAMKILRQEIMHNQAIVSRFIAEAQATAQLQHPGIVPVHEVGRLSDGRYYFTMREVRGRDFGKLIHDYHEARRNREEGIKLKLRRLIDAFHAVCEAVGYAHSRNVIHRDLKPENILIGEFGQVLVVDWGIAKVLQAGGEQEIQEVEGDGIVTSRSKDASQKTVFGSVAGTPAYMPIEQAAGDRERQGPHSDVYALGAILYEILGGRPPYYGFRGSAVLRELLEGPPKPLPDGGIPEGLRAICERAMARMPESRYPSARQLSEVIANWLDGAQRREEALEFLNRAISKSSELDKLRERAIKLREEAGAILDSTAGFAPAEQKEPAWRLLEHAEQLDRGSQLLEVNLIHHARAALERYPELEEAHDLLSSIYKRRVSEAEVEGDSRETERNLILLRNHHRGKLADYLVGDGAVTVVTDPEDAEVQIYQYVIRGRRQRLVPFGKPMRTPIYEVTLPMGSYLLQITKEGHEPVRYPVNIERQHHWDGVAPGESSPHPIYLPRKGELFVGDCYVPAGWFWAGGDPDAPNALPRTRVWVDGFVMQGIPVRNSAYVQFLEDLVKYRRDDDAINYAPARVRSRQIQGTMAQYARDRHGVWVLNVDEHGNTIGADTPVMTIDWEAALGFSRWLAEEDGLPWRLPHELEWEKCARGTDGRGFPMGAYLDPTWACMGESHADHVQPATIFDFPEDESPYGARGMAGNVRDWCWNQYATNELDVRKGRLNAQHIRPQPEGPVYRATRGGAWGTTIDECRAAARSRRLQSDQPHDVGIRLARSLDPNK